MANGAIWSVCNFHVVHRWSSCKDNLLERLVANVTTVGRPDSVREASLEALGYICQDIVSSFPSRRSEQGRGLWLIQDSDVLVPQSNVILTALVYGMRKEETNDNVRLAATTAMLNSLEFTKNNFQNDVRIASVDEALFFSSLRFV